MAATGAHGSATRIIGRILAERMSQQFSTAMVAENRSCTIGNIGQWAST
jgi:tripartite-type tricarboxylate transporter receptor subunit TctC